MTKSRLLRKFIWLALFFLAITFFVFSAVSIVNAETSTPRGATNFLGLTDTPDSYSSQANKVVSVKADASGLEFTTGGGSMVYPAAGIALSTGSAWDTSITNNSTDWNTAFSWGNHASAGYYVGTASTIRGLFSAGTGIGYDNSTGIITNSLPDQTVAFTNGAGISVTGTYPNFTITSSITQYTDALARAAISNSATGLTYTAATGVLSLTSGYVIPTTTEESTWNGKENVLSFTSPLLRSTNTISLKGLTGFGSAGQAIVTNATTDGLEWKTFLTSLSGAFLLDQTTPQTVLNGTPVFDEGLTSNGRITVTDKGIEILGASTSSTYEMSSAPQIYGGHDYNFNTDGSNALDAANVLNDKATFDLIVVKVGDTKEIPTAGTTNWGVALCSFDPGGGTLYLTIYFKAGDFIDQADFESYISGIVGETITADYYDNGTAWNLQLDGTYQWGVLNNPIVSGFTDPPTFLEKVSHPTVFEADNQGNLELGITGQSSVFTNWGDTNSNGVTYFYNENGAKVKDNLGNELLVFNRDATDPFGMIFGQSGGDYPGLSLIGRVGVGTIDGVTGENIITREAFSLNAEKDDGTGTHAYTSLGDYDLAFNLMNHNDQIFTVLGNGMARVFNTLQVDNGIEMHGNINNYFGADVGDYHLAFNRSRASTTVVQAGDPLGEIDFNGYRGSAYETSAYIKAVVNGTVASNIPTDLNLYATNYVRSESKFHIGGDATQDSLFGEPMNKSLFVRTTTASDGFGIEEVNDGATGPTFSLYHNSASPANGDEVGRWKVYANDSAGNPRIFGQMNVKIGTVTTGATDGVFKFEVERGGGLALGFAVNMISTVDMVYAHRPFGTIDRDAYFGSKRVNEDGTVSEGNGFNTYIYGANGVANVSPDYNGGHVYLNGGAKAGSGIDGDVYAATTRGKLVTSNIEPNTDNTYYLGKNDDDTPKAWKGIILKDTTNGKYYRIEVISGVITATDLTD